MMLAMAGIHPGLGCGAAIDRLGDGGRRPRVFSPVMAKRNLGKMGESEFRLWCSQVDLAANAPDEDAGGWDYIVQAKTPVIPPELKSLDRLVLPPTFLVQVKASDSRASRPIALSNWLKLINPSLPAFVLLLNYDRGEHAKEACLIHVGEELIEGVLKRLRKLRCAEAGRLHKHSLYVPWQSESTLPTLNGAALLSRVQDHIGTDPNVYWEQKKRWYLEAGDRHYRARLVMTGDDDAAAEDQLVDFALGLRKGLPSTLTSFEEVRFGIPIPQKSCPLEVEITTSNLPHLAGNCELSDESGRSRTNLPCKLYHPRSLFPFISADRLRYRVATTGMDIILGTDMTTGLAHVHPLPAHEQRTVREWGRLFRFVNMFAGAEPPMRMTLHLQDACVETQIDGRGPLQFEPMYREAANAALAAEKALQALGLDTDRMVSCFELREHSERLQQAASLLTAEESKFEVVGKVEASTPDGRLVAAPMLAAFSIGRLLVVAGVSLQGQIACGSAVDGWKDYRVAAVRRNVLFVEVITMEPGRQYSAAGYLDRVSKMITAQGTHTVVEGAGEG